MITPEWIAAQRELIKQHGDAGNTICLPPGGGALAEALDEIEQLWIERANLKAKARHFAALVKLVRSAP